MSRICKLGVAVGKKGIGKTYQTTEMMKGYARGGNGVKPRRVLILDVNDEFEEFKAMSVKDVEIFSVHPRVEIRRIRPFKDDGSRMTLRDIADTLYIILDKYRGGMLLIEDINKYISDHLPNDLVGAICTNRHTNTDIIMHFQSIGRITSKIWQNLNWLRFHKNSDSVARHKMKFPDKIDLFCIVESMVNKKYYDGDNRFYLYIDVDEEKIYGEYDEELFNYAVDEYCSMNHRQVVKPYINKRNEKGKKVYTPQQAIAAAKEVYKKNYFR
tara:strand:- start:358 stop:1167 length:810 start_codon:yes stop_codon:yes gene_type:complete